MVFSKNFSAQRRTSIPLSVKVIWRNVSNQLGEGPLLAQTQLVCSDSFDHDSLVCEVVREDDPGSSICFPSDHNHIALLLKFGASLLHGTLQPGHVKGFIPRLGCSPLGEIPTFIGKPTECSEKESQ